MPQDNESSHRSSSGLLVSGGRHLFLIVPGVAWWRLHPAALQAGAAAQPETILSMHGSNTIGAQLAGALAEAF